MISMIAAIGKNRELGLKNGLVFNIKEDDLFLNDIIKGVKSDDPRL